MKKKNPSLKDLAEETQIPIAHFQRALGSAPKVVCKATTIDGARRAYKGALNREGRRAAFKRWDALSLDEVEKASTLKEIQRIYFDTPEGSRSERAALVKMWGLYQNQ